jgi:putative ABC transport system permease protein
VSQRDLIRLVLSNLNRMRARVALTAIGVIIGTAAVVVLISLGIGLQNSAARSFNGFGDLTEITIYPSGAFSNLPGAAAQSRQQEKKLDDKTLAAWAKLPYVTAVTPRLGLQGMGELKLGRITTGANIQGIDPKAAEHLGWKLASGSPRLGRGQIVVGPAVFAEDNGPGMMGSTMVIGAGANADAGAAGGAETPGATPTAGPNIQGRQVALTLSRTDDNNTEVKRTERLRVAGVFEKSGGQSDYQVYLSQQDVDDYNQWLSGKRRDKRAGYDQALVKVDDRKNVSAVAKAIKGDGFLSFSAQDALNSINSAFLVIQLILGGIGAVALVVAAIGIANTMTMAIYERTKEIGIMKALGATNRDVLRIFLTEAGTIGFIGGLLGVALGWAVGFGIDFFVRNQLQSPGSSGASSAIITTPLWLMAAALVFATAIGVVSGVYPALRAATLKPLQALRTE